MYSDVSTIVSLLFIIGMLWVLSFIVYLVVLYIQEKAKGNC